MKQVFLASPPPRQPGLQVVLAVAPWDKKATEGLAVIGAEQGRELESEDLILAWAACGHRHPVHRLLWDLLKEKQVFLLNLHFRKNVGA